MDTPDPDVVKDSQKSGSQEALPNVTPRSAGFGSPKGTQDIWTAHPRPSQVRQKAKASFLADDDDSDEGADEQHNTHVVADPREPFHPPSCLDSTASEPDSGLDGESDEGQDVYDGPLESPTPHGSQAAQMPPQSAQPIPRSSRTDSSDPFNLFESLKKHPPGAATSQKPLRRETEKPGSGRQGTTATKGKGAPRTQDNAPKPKTTTRRSLANSKVKLSALELEGDTEIGRPDSHKPQEYDYSLPASNSNSPATSPAKMAAVRKRQAVRRPVLKSKTKAGEAKTASTGRKKNGEDAPAASVQPGSATPSGEEENEAMALKEETSVAKRAPCEDNMSGKTNTAVLKPDRPASEEDEDHGMTSDSASSFPESDNTDDEDFECTRKMTPANARRRTRAASAQSQARKEANAKVKNNPAPVSSSRPPEIEDANRRRNAGVGPNAQPKQRARKTATGKSQVVAAPAESTLERTEEKSSAAGKRKERESVSERRAAIDHTTKDKSRVEQDTAMSSNARAEGSGASSKPVQTSEPARQLRGSIRKPNIVAFGLGGPKINGMSHTATATTDSRSQGQQLGLSNGEHPAASKTQPAEGSQKVPRMQFKTTVQDRDSPTNGFGGHGEIDIGRVARPSQPGDGRFAPSHAPNPKADTSTIVPHSDAETTELNFEAEGAHLFDNFVAADAEADTLVEGMANVMADPQAQQKAETVDGGGENWDGEAPKPLADHVKHLHIVKHRTVLGEVDANHRRLARDAPASLPYSKKRKNPDWTTVAETLPKKQSPTSKIGLQSENFPAAFSPESDGRPVKKPRYNADRAVRVDEGAGYVRELVGGPGNLPPRGEHDNGDDVFWPGKKNKPSGSSAFVQRLIGSQAAERGSGQAAPGVAASSDTRAAPRQPNAAIHHQAKLRSVAPVVASLPQGSQQLDDMGKRMLAAMERETSRCPNPCPPSDEHGESFPRDEPRDTWLGDTFEQSKASDMDERTRAWKKATEPYAESLGETMHRIVNVS